MKKLILLLLLCHVSSGFSQNSEKKASIVAFQKKMNADFRSPERTPLPAKEREAFDALDFFPIDTNFYVVAEFVRTPFESPFEMPTTTERKPVYVKFGELYFHLQGEQYKLNLYQNQNPKPGYEDHLFLPFTDLTNGKLSYSGGRYIDIIMPVSDKVVVDFNKAYNPYCAYNGTYSCPIPPEENHLDLEVNAGVKAYKK